jgi:hypothetical protein
MMGVAVLAAAGAFPAMADPVSIPDQIDPLDLYGNEVLFDVMRDGEPIGNYLVRFKKDGGELQVETRASIEVEVLFAPAYRLRYQSFETWRDGWLTKLTASTNDDGEFSHVEAKRQGQSLEVIGTDGAWDAASTALPTTHWNMAQIATPTLINTVHGDPNHVVVTEAEIENVPFGDEQRPARRFVYSGDLEMEAWYDDAGRWVKLRFAAKDGSTIEYLCRQCSGPTRVTKAE